MWRCVACSSTSQSSARRLFWDSRRSGWQRWCSTSDRPIRPVEQAYSEWSAASGACDVHEFLRGAGQAYLAVGATIEAALRLPKGRFDGSRILRLLKREEPLGASTTVAGSDVVAGVASPHPRASTSAVADENSSSADLVFDELENLVGDSLRKHLVHAIQETNKGRFNAYLYAHPNDYVVSARLHAFQRFDTAPSATSPTQDAPRKPELSQTDAKSSNTVGVAAAKEDSGVRPVGISGVVPPTSIPKSANAYAVVSLHVVLPFRRFYRLADWFADRIEGYESENERYALATFFSANFATGVVLFVDRVMQMLTGSPMVFQVTKPLKSVLHLPDDAPKCPPCKRKYVGLYHSAEGNWVLAEVTNSVEVYDQVVEGADTV